MGRYLIAVVVFLADTGLLVAGRPTGSARDAAGYALVVALIIALRYRAPVGALMAALVLLALTDGGYVLLLWVAYRAGRETLSRAGTVTVVGALSGAVAVQLLSWPADPRMIPNLVSTYLVFAVLPLLVGRYLAQHERLVSTLDRHNRQLRRERALLADQEQLRERLRIARDMHDSLGHRLSLVSVQAAALEVAELPPAQRQAVRQLARAARGAMDDLYEVLGTLRTTRGTGLRSPGAETIGPLVAEFQAAGVPVTMREHGTPRPLGPAGQAAYRVIEEGLTNAVKHAPGQPVTVRLQWEPDALLLTLDNPLPACSPGHTGTDTGPPSSSGPDAGPLCGDDAGDGRAPVASAATARARSAAWPVGHGLAGLRERVDQAGGLVEHRVSEHGWRLFAMLPAAEDAGGKDTGEVEDPLPALGVRGVAVGVATAALMFVALPASVLVGVR